VGRGIGHGSLSAERWALALLVLCGCPKRFDPRADPIKGSPDAEADRDYRDAKARLEVGDAKEAAARFAAFLERHPSDPLVPSAKLGQARARLALGEADKAKEVLEPLVGKPGESLDPVAAATESRARFLLGFVLHKTGELKRSRELLQPFVGQVAGDDESELHAVLADDAYGLGDLEGALTEYDLFFRGARPGEKRFLRDRAEELTAKLSAESTRRLYDVVGHDGLAAAYLGRRLGQDREAAGDAAGARRVLDETEGARERLGLTDKVRRRAAEVQVVRAIGCVLPLSGSRSRTGERALRGVLLGADAVAAGGAGGLEVRVRDSGSDPAQAAAALEELAKEGVLAVIGPPDNVQAVQVQARAEALALPLFELAPNNAHGSQTFKVVRGLSREAEALGALAGRSGAHTVAVLAPESDYGRRAASAFIAAAKQVGARVVADLRYKAGSTTFIEPAKKLFALKPDALYVPASAMELASIALQLTSTGVTRLPGIKQGKTSRLYATAEGMNAAFVQSTARYLEGAVLAPSFYADPSSPRVADFVDRYHAAFAGEEPSAADALAFDAVHAARIALEQASVASSGQLPTRGQLAAQLQHVKDAGVSGPLGFSSSGDRVGSAPLYVVEGGQIHAFH
jgi:ABC-type branched-subunit amino acid transport system substrate-binding protein